MAIFGNTVLERMAYGAAEDYKLACRYPLTEKGEFTSLWAYLRPHFAGETCRVIMGMHADNPLSDPPTPTNLLASSEEVLVTLEQWYQFPLLSPVILSPAHYWPTTLNLEVIDWGWAETISEPNQTARGRNIYLDGFDPEFGPPESFVARAMGFNAEYTPIAAEYFTLSVDSNPFPAIEITVDGIAHTTPYSELLPEGIHPVTAPSEITSNGQTYYLLWEDGSTDPARTVNLTGDLPLVANYVLPIQYAPFSVISLPIEGASGTVMIKIG